MSFPNPEQVNPSTAQQEDGYSRGVDVIALIAGEFGLSKLVVRQQLSNRENEVEITIDGTKYEPTDKRNKYMIPYHMASGKTIEVIADRLQFRFQFKG